MIEIIEDDIFQSGFSEALVNPVNCDGVMGKGLALEFKKRFPDMFKSYVSWCRSGLAVFGQLMVWENPNFKPKYIICFPTKVHWVDKSKMEYIDYGLISLVTRVRVLGVKSISIPALGCGLGGLEWGMVFTAITQYMYQLPDVHTRIYPPYDTRPTAPAKQIPPSGI